MNLRDRSEYDTLRYLGMNVKGDNYYLCVYPYSYALSESETARGDASAGKSASGRNFEREWLRPERTAIRSLRVCDTWPVAKKEPALFDATTMDLRFMATSS
jgi:hypothetical protein